MTFPPRILIIIPDQWPRALLRAALREAGYDAVGARSVHGAVRHAGPAPGRGPVALVVLDHDAVAADPDAFDALMAASGRPPAILVAHATREPPAGPWARIVRRPLSVHELAADVETMVPLAPELRHPIDSRTR